MVAIKGMKIPNRCEECKFCLRQGANDYGSFGECLLQKNKRVNCLTLSRDDDCPLVEVITCKDCKHWDKKEKYCEHLANTIGWFVCTSEDFYCKNAERKDNEQKLDYTDQNTMMSAT